jgi:diguanylate cyclase (GGDEF)-like protein
MSEVVEHLAELTAHRDRDLLDSTLVASFRDLLRPRSVAIWRAVGEIDDPRWISRARIEGDETVPGVDPVWSDLESLPRLDDYPQRAQVLAEARAFLLPPQAAGELHCSLFPIASDHEVLGVLEIETEAPLPEQSQQLVTSMLRIVRNFQALLDYSERDNLTGLLNRKTFDDSFLKLLERRMIAADGRRGAGAAGHWLAVIDIDHFKRVNDGFGHLIGDEVLLLLSRLMRRCFRADDQLYRFGGEEFVVLMRCHGEASAALALERLRAAVERYAFPQVGHITVSVGFTGVQRGDAPSAAFDRADKAVYHAKGHGRNQVCSHAELVARGLLADETKTGIVELF